MMNEREFWNALIEAFGGTGDAVNEQDAREKLVAAIQAGGGGGLEARVQTLEGKVEALENPE